MPHVRPKALRADRKGQHSNPINELLSDVRVIRTLSAARITEVRSKRQVEDAIFPGGDLEHLEIAQPAEITSVCRSEVNLRGAPEHSGDDDLAEVGVRLEADRHQELGTARRDAASFW